MNNWSGNENDIMRGYIVRAAELLAEEPDSGFTTKQIGALLRKLYRATDEMTAEEAYNYYMNSEYF